MERADSLYSCGLLDSAIYVATEYLNSVETSGAIEDTALASAHYRLGRWLMSARDFNASIDHLKASAGLYTELNGPQSLELAESLYYIGGCYLLSQRYAEADPYFERAMVIRENVLPENHYLIGKSLIGYGNLRKRQGRNLEAAAMASRSLKCLESHYGRSHPEVAKPLSTLADMALINGQPEQAIEYTERALEIRRSQLGDRHPEVAKCLNKIALTHYQLGHYELAEPMLERALSILEEDISHQADRAANVATNLGLVYIQQRRWDQAEAAFQKAIGWYSTKLDEGNERVLTARGYLADVALYRDDFEGAAEIIEKTIRRARVDHGDSSMVVAGLRNSLADVRLRQNRFEEADSLFRLAGNTIAVLRGVNNGEYLRSLHGRIETSLQRGPVQGDIDSLLRSAAAICAGTYGEVHPQTAFTYELLARYLRQSDQAEEAVIAAAEAVEIRSRHLSQTGVSVSESDALRFSSYLRESADLALCCYSDIDNPDSQATRIIAKVVLTSKGPISDAIFKRRRFHRLEQDPFTDSLLAEYQAASQGLADLFLSDPDPADQDPYLKRLESARARLNSAEVALARHGSGVFAETDRSSVDADQVAEALPDGNVLVEYAQFDFLPPNDTVSESRLCAITVRPDGQFRWYDLGEMAAVDSLVRVYRSHIERVASAGHPPDDADRREYLQIAMQLHDAVWRPLEIKSHNPRLVVVAPEGSLNLLPFEALTSWDRTYLVEEYTLHYLSAGRDLLRLGENGESGTGMLALGDPDFAANPFVEEEVPETPLDRRGISDPVLRSGNHGVARPERLARLAATRDEVESAGKRFAKSLAEPVTLLTGKLASKDRFVLKCADRRVVHLATHGYATESVGPVPGGTEVSHAERPGQTNPLLLSGLYLTGATCEDTTVSPVDGTLTAQEVSGLDLSGCRWVVLSACQSGMGRIETSEGTYGLRRAFQMAGARTVVSTLWRIDDNLASRIMSKLYHNPNLPMPELMQSLAVDELSRLRRRGQPDHPINWAGFIAVGDWRPLK